MSPRSDGVLVLLNRMRPTVDERPIERAMFTVNVAPGTPSGIGFVRLRSRGRPKLQAGVFTVNIAPETAAPRDHSGGRVHGEHRSRLEAQHVRSYAVEPEGRGGQDELHPPPF